MDSDKKARELWHKLDNESERAHRAFEIYRNLPSGERTLIAAYRRHVGNPEAIKPSDTWSTWSTRFAWRERAAAYDDHLESMRREAYERGVEEEAERQGALAERNRNRMNEMLTLGYERAAEWFEHTQPSDLRAQDVIGIIRLHMDVVKAFEVEREFNGEGDWTEEDEAALDEIAKEVDALTDLERPEEQGDGEDSEEGSGEEDSESDCTDETG